MAEAKTRELDEAIARATTTKAMLEAISRCRCESWEECGTALLDRFGGGRSRASVPMPAG